MPWWNETKPKNNKKPQQRLTDWGDHLKITNNIMTHLIEIQIVEALNNQVSTPKTWDKATARVNIGDYIRAPFTPIMQVIDKDVYPNGQT